ncbi:MAG TPA: hypothetical protein VF469_34440 [Kofleriaceae bacterium]
MIAAALVVSCGSPLPRPERPLPPGMKGSCEPPGGTISAVIGPVRAERTVRVTVRDLDGTDRNQVAAVTLSDATGWSVFPEGASAQVSDEPGTWLLRDQPAGGSGGVPGDLGWGPTRITAGKEVALEALGTAEKYWLEVDCEGNGVDALVPSVRDRLIDIIVKVDCTGGWGLPIFGGGDRERDGIGWHLPD